MASGRRETGGVVDRGKHLTKTRGKPPGGGEREGSGTVVFRPVLGCIFGSQGQPRSKAGGSTIHRRNGQPAG